MPLDVGTRDPFSWVSRPLGPLPPQLQFLSDFVRFIWSTFFCAIWQKVSFVTYVSGPNLCPLQREVVVESWLIATLQAGLLTLFLIPLMLCVLILYISRCQFKVDSKWQIFLRNFSLQFLFTLIVFARNLLRGNSRRNTFRISFWCLVWDANPGFSSNKPTYYLLDHGDFIYTKYFFLSVEINFFCLFILFIYLDE